MVRSFNWGYETVTRRWAAAARTVIEFDRANRDSGLKYLIVKYEDLVLDPDTQLKVIFDFLDLDAATYDFNAAHSLPVFGSSVFRGKGQDVHWGPVAKTQDFQSLRRWEHWNRYRRRRFQWLAGCPLFELGYEEAYKRYTGISYHHLIDGVGG